MKPFSERYGYTKLSDVIIKEKITPEVENAICSAYSDLENSIYNFIEIEEYLWTFFFNQDKGDFKIGNSYRIVSIPFIKDDDEPWYKKMDLIEKIIEYLNIERIIDQKNHFINYLNSEFERLHFGYRIINGVITEITSKQEINSIEEALTINDQVNLHFSMALEKIKENDYRNSIKESISAVEVINRQITGKNTLNFGEMEKKGLKLPSVLRKAFENLYGYTNDPSTGIRHCMINDENVPTSDEAYFMLIACSAFVNYLNKKLNL